MMISVSDNDFEKKVLESKLPVLIDFWAEWCGPCKQLTPILDEVALSLSDKILIGKINIDENPETPSRFNVRGIPTLIIFKDGKQIAVKVGALPKTSLIEWINNYIDK